MHRSRAAILCLAILRMDVDKILSAGKSEHKSTVVSKEVDLQFDVGNLLATDLNSLDTEALR